MLKRIITFEMLIVNWQIKCFLQQLQNVSFEDRSTAYDAVAMIEYDGLPGGHSFLRLFEDNLRRAVREWSYESRSRYGAVTDLGCDRKRPCQVRNLDEN